MLDGSSRKQKIGGVSEVAVNTPQNHPTRQLLVSIIGHSFLTVALIAAAAVFFQAQITSLRRDLAALKHLSVEEGNLLRIHKKRDSSEVEDMKTNQREGVKAVHLLSSVPFQHIHTNGKIGPWASLPREIEFVSLNDRNMEVKILKSGLYFIYAQIYYLTSEPSNSFQILLRNGTRHKNLASCASSGGEPIREASCFTAFSRKFTSGEKFFLNQIEQNRLIHFNNGCSFLGIILLESENG